VIRFDGRRALAQEYIAKNFGQSDHGGALLWGNLGRLAGRFLRMDARSHLAHRPAAFAIRGLTGGAIDKPT
jgi:hypothetical protein